VGLGQLHGVLEAACHKRQAHHGVGLCHKSKPGLVVPPVGVALAPAAGVKARQQRASAAGGAARGDALVRRRPYTSPSAAAELGFAGAVVVIGVVFAVVSAAVAVFVDVIKVLAAAFTSGSSGSSGSSNPNPSSSARSPTAPPRQGSHYCAVAPLESACATTEATPSTTGAARGCRHR
jgi:hypothetical protein